jgi:hypothetical protein
MISVPSENLFCYMLKAIHVSIRGAVSEQFDNVLRLWGRIEHHVKELRGWFVVGSEILRRADQAGLQNSADRRFAFLAPVWDGVAVGFTAFHRAAPSKSTPPNGYALKLPAPKCTSQDVWSMTWFESSPATHIQRPAEAPVSFKRWLGAPLD